MKVNIALTLCFLALVNFCHIENVLAHSHQMSLQTDVVTVGNHSYIKIGVHTTPDAYVDEILNILAWFEETNSDKEVTAWRVEKQQRDTQFRTVGNYIFGLWVDHKPK